MRKLQHLLLFKLALNVCIFSFISMPLASSANKITIQHNTKETQEFNASSTIKSIKIHRVGWELADPVIALNSSDRILLSFDDISDSPGTYSYSIAHCDGEWQVSSIFLNDYLEGFEVNEVRDYSFSSGTVMSYMHCRLELPNADVRLKLSGNYLLKVFNTYEPEKVLFQRRFVLYEPLVDITASIRQPSAGEQRLTSQQIDLKLNTKSLRVTDPATEIKTVVCQNHLFQGCHQNLKPAFIRGNDIDYCQPTALIFEAGNEFRFFDSKSIRYNGQGIKSIDFTGGEFHMLLTTDQTRRRNGYTYYPDLNGRFVINLERSTQSHLEADYVWTYFTLNVPMELDEGKNIYLFGEFTGWELSPKNRMIYNPERGAYELRMLLKQGAYNYRYLVFNEKTGTVDLSHFEGNYFDTENSYSILVNYKPLGARYNRVVGYHRISTRQ